MLGATTTTNTTTNTTSMLGATATTTNINTAMLVTAIASHTTSLTTNMESNTPELTCRTCVTTLESKEAKRVHMRDDWHVYNLKRRIADLPPISQTTFRTQIRPSPSIPSAEEEEDSDAPEHDTLSLQSSSEAEDLSEVSGDDSEQETEDAQERYGAVRIGDDLRLQSGKIIGHRSHARNSRRQHHDQHQRRHLQPPDPSPSRSASPPLSPETINLILSHRPSTSPSPERPIEPPSQSLVTRKGTETSLVGIPEKQQRALAAVAKKMEASGGRTMNEFQAGLERKGNCQKTFRVKSIGKKAGGLEKRLG